MAVITHSDDAVMDFIDAWAHDYANADWRELSGEDQMRVARAMMDLACQPLRGAVACRDALAKFVRDEYPADLSLAEIAETWGVCVGLTDEERTALREWGQ